MFDETFLPAFGIIAGIINLTVYFSTYNIRYFCAAIFLFLLSIFMNGSDL